MATMARKRKPPGKKATGAQNPSVNWPKVLKDLRIRLGNITQAEAARRLGVSTRTWISWENNQRKPSATATRLLYLTFPELLK